ncbi:hypothetical protein BJX61DRAFT_509999 [Aspergillus egyptiacus]|nr:hypothetical protein BJX61DRAFT_509999 [Aspergillus egyptiacus]
MTASPPASPTGPPQRPFSALMRTPRSNSRMSVGSRHGGSRASDDDAKTAVKVAVRVRPPLKPTDPGYELIPQRFQRSMVHVTSPTSLAVDVPQGRKLFVFDRVFPETVDQEGIWEYLSDSVNSFLQGYNVSILAYGQSGAGKSYTMGTSGPKEQNKTEAMGIIPRAAQLLFEKLEGPKHNRSSSTGLRTPSRYSISSTSSFGKTNADKSWQLKATYVEIYNEQLRDLLVPDSTAAGDRSAVTIREDTKGRIILTGLHQVTINSFEDLIGALNFGSSIRQTDSTAINAKSSRSHAVFSLNLVQRKSGNGITSPKDKRMSAPVEMVSGADQTVTVDSKLHFVDLAGSERLKNTGASGERAREGISINAGLAALGKVISQLSSRHPGSHVSYRDSKLTRLLQDSLGGNAYTYMIACVTPAEFHLSETLNTVQYAQRARAIQSKPRLQQVADDSDKNAVIERLKAEVAFLRQQLRNVEENDRRTAAPQDRTERQNEREMELQNQILDIQESYNALSQRHAKLISELARDSEQAGENEGVEPTLGSAVERLKRSHSFAESVEQVVLEYEKTIQSLESSLSNTRSSLSMTESTLLERETKCAYVETVNSQLQARVQKLLDREASTESYLHELESRIDGQASGEEKHNAIVSELRKELGRVRESEASCEQYISTLEERLAEADQDMELMQREVERLEHVVERQRSLSKLDNLLYELDHIQQNGTNKEEVTHEPESYKAATGAYQPRKRGMSLDVLTEAVETAIPESDEEFAEPIPEDENENSEHEALAGKGDSDLKVLEETASRLDPVQNRDALDPPPSPGQMRVVSDKLETVSQELFDLRMQHENTVNEYELLEAKYEEALKALAELQQDAADEARHPAAKVQQLISTPNASRPVSFLEELRQPAPKSGTQHSFSQSLSSELSLAGEPVTSQDSYNANSEATQTTVDLNDAGSEDDGSREVENMRKLLQDHQENVSAMTEKYAELQAEHEDTLNLIESLKAELQRSRSASPPTTPGFVPVIRRKTSQSVMSNVDRAHRSISGLRTLAVEEFASRPDTMQNFELHLEAAMHELHVRMERIQQLEAENQSVKKEMEMKATIISGLTRERSSLQGGSPVDMGLVHQLRDQVVQQENALNQLKEEHAMREKVLLEEIEDLKALLTTQEEAAKAQDTHVEEQELKITQLEGELTEWKGKHQTAIESLQSSEKQLKSTLEELSSALATIDAMRSEGSAAAEDAAKKEEAAKELESERARQKQVVEELTRKIEEHEAMTAAHLEKIASLEKVQETQKQATDLATSSEELEVRQARISELEQEIDGHKSLIESYKKDLESFQESHRKELSELEERAKAAAEAEHELRLAEENKQHEEAMKALQSEISASREELKKLLKMVSDLIKSDVTAENLADQIQDILMQKQHFSDKYSELMDTNEELRKQFEASKNHESRAEELNQSLSEKDTKVNELAVLVATLEDTLRQRDEQIKKKESLLEEALAEKQKSARLVEELEEQITNSFDQHNNRLSVIQQEREQALEEAKAKIATYENDIETYRVRIEQLELQIKNQDVSHHDRSSSITSNLRKSSSAASLPSPPPAIPLPPLPTIAATASGASSPPSSRHASKEIAGSQIVEEQEARIRTIEKHLNAEKQLTATLEEALGDLEAQSNKVRSDCEAWKKKAWELEEELTTLRKERNTQRLSLQQVEEERNARREAEAARAQLEERMAALNKKKKKSTLNCF